MDEKELKTNLKTRIFIILIAILMLGSVIASYALIVASGNKSGGSSNDGAISEEKLMEYEKAYEVAAEKMANVSEKYYSKLLSYKNRVKGFNEAAANSSILKTEDLETGNGRELSDGDNDYVAYYIGWCGNEMVFDSSFDDFSNPTKLIGFFDVKTNDPIEGWKAGMEGMKLGGVRELTIAADLAYKDGEICGKTYQPIKFIVLAIAREGEIRAVADEVSSAQMRLQYAYYGIDYSAMSE